MTMTGSGNIPANHTDVWLGRFSNDWQYARGGEEDGYGGPGLVVWWWYTVRRVRRVGKGIL